MSRIMWRHRRCRWFGHHWSVQLTFGGRSCTRCGKLDIPVKQMFGPIHISGPRKQQS